MKKIKLGSTGVEISKLGLGAWAIGGGSWWGDNDDAESVASIHAALEQGFTLVDTAPAYGFGHSETVVGKAINDRRENVVLSTKCALHWDEKRGGSLHAQRDGHTVYRNLSAKSIKLDLEASLKRLNTDYIDIYITHWQSAPEFPVPVSETVAALMEMKQQGKIRAIGASNVNADIIKEYLKHGELNIIQERYTMLDREKEDLFELCREKDIAIMAYSPLEQGLFTGKYGREYEPEAGSSRSQRVWFKPKNFQLAWDMMDKWDVFCEKYGCTMAQLAIAWTAAQAEHLQVLVGARKIEQIADNVKGGELVLAPEDVALMRRLAVETVPVE